jgi:hypothetical protein
MHKRSYSASHRKLTTTLLGLRLTLAAPFVAAPLTVCGADIVAADNNNASEQVFKHLSRGLGSAYSAFVVGRLSGAHPAVTLLTPDAMAIAQQNRCLQESRSFEHSNSKPAVCGGPKPFLVSADHARSWVPVGDMHPLLTAAAIVYAAGFRTRSQNEDLRAFFAMTLGITTLAGFERDLLVLWPDRREITRFQRSSSFVAEEEPIMVNNDRNQTALEQATKRFRSILRTCGVVPTDSPAERSMMRASVIAIRAAVTKR